MPFTGTVTLQADAGGPESNSYATLLEANYYNNSRIQFTSGWTNATDPQKIAALIDSARLLDAVFDWNGAATLQTQFLQWPRSGLTGKTGYPLDPMVVPQQIKDAQSEFARQLLDQDRGADNDAVKNEVLGVSAGPVRVNFRATEGTGGNLDSRNADVRRKGPDLEYLSKVVPDEVRRLIVKTWYKQALISQPIIFQAMGGPGRRVSAPVSGVLVSSGQSAGVVILTID